MPAAIVERIAAMVQPFADFYSGSKALSAATTVMHIGGLLAGGGLAIATDRTVLRVSPDNARAQRVALLDLAATHRLVIGALVAIAISGAMFLAADVKTFAVSRLYWTKMAFVFALLLNGLRLWRAETRVNRSTRELGDAAAVSAGEWGVLRQSAILSLILWFTIMTLGVVLANS